MRVDSAVELINNLVYKPGWKIEATAATKRYEGTIKVKVTYPAFNSDRDEAPGGYSNFIDPDGAYASFNIICEDCDDVSLYRKLLETIMVIEEHEAREFLRVVPTYWAPFHPHRVDGMKRFGKVEHDLTFGLA
jgi:hypothetical protein